MKKRAELITIGQFIKTLSSSQYLEIFSANRETLDIETCIYKVEDIPSKLKALYIAYVASGTPDSLQIRPRDEFRSVILVDAYDTKREAREIISQIQKSHKKDYKGVSKKE